MPPLEKSGPAQPPFGSEFGGLHRERLLCALEHLWQVEAHGPGRASRARRVEPDYLPPQGLKPSNECREGAIAGNSGGVRIGHVEHRLAGTDGVHREAVAYVRRAHRFVGTAL